MDNGALIDDFLIQTKQNNSGFSMAILNNQMVYLFKAPGIEKPTNIPLNIRSPKNGWAFQVGKSQAMDHEASAAPGYRVVKK